jgi:hypothetical protein
MPARRVAGRTTQPKGDLVRIISRLRARLLQCPPLVFSLISVLARALFGQSPVKPVGFCPLLCEARRMMSFVGFLFCTTRKLSA